MITYTFKIKTTKKQIQLFEEHLNTTRMLYNLAKETKEYAYSKGIILSKFDLINQLPELKKEFRWISNVHSGTHQTVIERLDRGYNKFFSDLKRGIITSKPKWAKKKDWKSITFKSSAVRLKNNQITLSKIGKIKVFKSREINGNIKVVRVIKEVDGWYLQIVTDCIVIKCDNQTQVAVDSGIKYAFVTSDGQFFENIRTTEKYEKQLAEAQRKLSLKKKGSNNFYKESERVKKIYLKIRRVREDYLHKISRELSNNYQTVFVEDLNVSKMVLDKNYSKVISDVSWSKFFEYLSYKTELIKVDAKYTSQECSNCGHISKENRPNQETFKCVKCNHQGNADFNASKVVLKRGLA